MRVNRVLAKVPCLAAGLWFNSRRKEEGVHVSPLLTTHPVLPTKANEQATSYKVFRRRLVDVF